MTTPDEYKRAAMCLEDLRAIGGYSPHKAEFVGLAITALERLAKGELVERAEPRCRHLSTYTTDDGACRIVLCQACGELL